MLWEIGHLILTLFWNILRNEGQLRLFPLRLIGLFSVNVTGRCTKNGIWWNVSFKKSNGSVALLPATISLMILFLALFTSPPSAS